MKAGGNSGLSLLELAIVMVVSGLLLAGMMRLFETLRTQWALKTTRQRIETLQQRLDEFADKNERFPCPLPPAAGAFAAEPADCSNPDLQPGERDVAQGVVPVAALGIMPEDARDGWGNMFTYAVSAALTKKEGMRGLTPPPGVIGLVDGYGDNVLEKPDSARYVIISHGPHGEGGFTPQGVPIPCPAGTLSAKNCHAPGVFVDAPWSTAPGPFFFDNIVASDGSRRQARLLERLDYCGRIGRYYSPSLFFADSHGCVADDKVYGACTVETSYMDQSGGASPFTGDWDQPAQAEWWPAKSPPEDLICECDKKFLILRTGSWELPLHHPDPPLTPQQNCEMAAEHERGAIAKDMCRDNPPAVDIKLREWKYDYLATPDGKVLKESGARWMPDDNKNWSILPVDTIDDATGRTIRAKAAASTDMTRAPLVRRVTWGPPVREINHKLTLYACTRK